MLIYKELPPGCTKPLNFFRKVRNLQRFLLIFQHSVTVAQ